MLRKFLVREPYKRSGLEILIDDPWINETYGDSPIVQDLGESVQEDESIIKLVEVKFKIDREQVVAAIRDGSYNDVAALYYLLYYEKDNEEKNITLESQDIIQVTSRAKGASMKPEKAMIKIEEDSVINNEDIKQSQTASTKQSGVIQLRRRRAQTVIDSTNEDSIDECSIRDNSRTENKPEPIQIRENSIESDSRPKTTAGHIQSAFEATPGQTCSDEKKGRARTNTIAGIFRKISDAGSSSPVAQNSEDSNKPRSLRFTFNSNTTSTKPPDEFVADVIKICNTKGITYRLQTRYLLECTYSLTQDGNEPVKFEVEICKLPRLNSLHGLRFKRLSGSSADYKDVCEIILSAIQN